MSFNKSMFGGISSHKFAGGGVPISSKAWSFYGYRPVSHATVAKTGSSIASQNAQKTPRFSHIPEDVEEKQISVKDLSTEELAKLTIKDKLGNGKARKSALGSRYSEVQKKVNELLSGSSKKVKVDDERGGKKEIEIPAWVGRADELNLEMNPIENRLPKTRDVRDAMIEGVSLKDKDREPSYDADDLQRYLLQNPIEEFNLGVPSDELIRRARLAAR